MRILYRVGIVGATGYTGAELIRILNAHPKVRVTKVYSRTYAGSSLSEIFPGFTGLELNFLDPETDDFADLDLLFLAVPAGVAAKYAQRFAGKVIDLGADFRFQDQGLYETVYGQKHLAPELLSEAVYGLPELFRQEIKESRIIGNPGCFPTSITLGVAPLIQYGYEGEIVVASLSGTSGAGKGLSDAQHFAHRHENFGPYKVGNHRHVPEIESVIYRYAKKHCEIVFVPHLVPAIRGIVSTIYLDKIVSLNEARKLYEEFYADEYFVRVRKPNETIESKDVVLSNFVDIQIYEDSHVDKLIVVSTIDNLIKGASGQAVQNMNILLDIPEETALESLPVYP